MRQTEAEEADAKRQEILAQDQERQKRAEDDHLGDEHSFAPEIVGQSAEQQCAE